MNCLCNNKGDLCNWAESDIELCKTNNNTNKPLYLCNKCAHWKCKVCKIKLCKNCYIDIMQTDSAYCYLQDICIVCKKLI